MANLNFFGFIDSTFVSIAATRISKSGGASVDGIWTPGTTVQTSHIVNIQPVTNKEIQQLSLGAERIGDMRKIYVNDGDLYSITDADDWTFASSQGAGGTFKTVSLDNRPWRNYCKVIVSQYDN